MVSNWKISSLSNIAELAMGQSPAGDTCNTQGNGAPLLNGPTEFGSHHPAPVQFTTDPKRFAKSGDLLFCVRGSTTGRMNWADQNYAIGRGIAAMRHLAGPQYQAFLRAIIEDKLPSLLATATGSTFPNVSRNQLLGLEVHIPPIDDQKAIAHILGTLDDKMEFNRQMNATLEAMAQALFKSWFVDFDPVIDNALAAGNPIPAPMQARAERRKALGDRRKPLPEHIQSQFPASFVFSEEMGWMPGGWTASEVNDFIEVTDYVANGSFAALKENVKLYDEPNYALYIRTTDFRHNFDKHSAKYVDRSSYDFLRKSFLDGSEVIINNVGNGVGTVFRPPCWLATPMTLGANAIALKTKGFSNFTELYFTSHQGQYQISSIVGGSAQPKFNKTDFRALRVCFGSQSLVAAFEGITEKFSTRKNANKSQLTQLINLRDALLPKLLSGELRIPDAEKLVANAP